ncbi:MAG: branched-chain amino acid ABC transporter permease [Gemmatimonadota bacterium]|jgi:branched-chain amino acid transport system permease protein|nr:branched-chain amino acid ABC transporter permease [Gemmatimonadota bacterium]
MRLRNLRLTTRYQDDLVLFRTRLAMAGMAALLLAAVTAPLVLGDFWVTVLIYAGIAAVGAIGLNILTGFTGQISLGHAFFLGVGAYAAAVLAGRWGLPFPLWLIGAAAMGGIIGGLVGPFALRLRGHYLAIVSLGLLFLGSHVFEHWTAVTGGLTGRAISTPIAIGPVNLDNLAAVGIPLNRNQGFFYFTWLVVGVLALAAKNLLRTRPGRALQAVRDRDQAAEVIGVSLVHWKVGAFVVSSGYAACAGAMYAAFARYVSPLDWSLFLSIQYVAMIVVGGIGSVAGAILGALFLTLLPRLVEAGSGRLPFLADAGSGGGITVFALNQMLFGLLIIGFLLWEPMGLIELWRRLKRYFASWPFSY